MQSKYFHLCKTAQKIGFVDDDYYHLLRNIMQLENEVKGNMQSGKGSSKLYYVTLRGSNKNINSSRFVCSNTNVVMERPA